MRQRITKSYQPKPCQISKHNHYVNPSLLLLLHSEDALSLWTSGHEQSPSSTSSSAVLEEEEEVMEPASTGSRSLAEARESRSLVKEVLSIESRSLVEEVQNWT